MQYRFNFYIGRTSSFHSQFSPKALYAAVHYVKHAIKTTNLRQPLFIRNSKA